ncbi:hypothetical protein [Celerinatantimonas sp. YJH-8]|uniref:hypothetical protein n=1 Tax=Celerinatantimonas sp. YJH-8 TaxID=3228714 RepID=UPI0038BF307F
MAKKYLITPEQVINFDCNGVIPADQHEIFYANYIIYTPRGEPIPSTLKVYRNATHMTWFDLESDEPSFPELTLPLETADWLLKTRPRFGLPPEQGGAIGMGFSNFVKGEDIWMGAGLNWSIGNGSRPLVHKFDSKVKQGFHIPHDLFERDDFQAFLKSVAAEYPIQPGDVQIPADEVDYDYVNPPLWQAGLLDPYALPEDIVRLGLWSFSAEEPWRYVALYRRADYEFFIQTLDLMTQERQQLEFQEGALYGVTNFWCGTVERLESSPTQDREFCADYESMRYRVVPGYDPNNPMVWLENHSRHRYSDGQKPQAVGVPYQVWVKVMVIISAENEARIARDKAAEAAG